MTQLFVVYAFINELGKLLFIPTTAVPFDIRLSLFQSALAYSQMEDSDFELFATQVKIDGWGNDMLIKGIKSLATSLRADEARRAASQDAPFKRRRIM
jgi:hypothetical protein